MGILVLLIMNMIATMVLIVKRKYKQAIIFIIPIVGLMLAFIWYFTLLPYTLNFKATPEIHFIKIRSATEEEKNHFSYDINFPLYIIEFSADVRLDECRRSHYRLCCSSTESDFSYDDVLTNNDMVFFVSEELILMSEAESTYIYHAPIQFLSSCRGLISNNIVNINDMKNDLRCKVFFIGVLQPILSTSGMTIPIEAIKRALDLPKAKIVKNDS